MDCIRIWKERHFTSYIIAGGARVVAPLEAGLREACHYVAVDHESIVHIHKKRQTFLVR